MSFLEQIKAYLRKTPLYRPLKTLGALAGYGSYGLPFAHTVAAEPFLERAIPVLVHLLWITKMVSSIAISVRYGEMVTKGRAMISMAPTCHISPT